ncbi:MAG: hypothetical protein ACK53L_01365, partial [Pirellulaceae bacterium]
MVRYLTLPIQLRIWEFSGGVTFGEADSTRPRLVRLAHRRAVPWPDVQQPRRVSPRRYSYQ